MCGIIGITSNKPVSSAIINSLKKLEYRGYDSAGTAQLWIYLNDDSSGKGCGKKGKACQGKWTKEGIRNQAINKMDKLDAC